MYDDLIQEEINLLICPFCDSLMLYLDDMYECAKCSATLDLNEAE